VIVSNGRRTVYQILTGVKYYHLIYVLPMCAVSTTAIPAKAKYHLIAIMLPNGEVLKSGIKNAGIICVGIMRGKDYIRYAL
jgi:hypothetical protein